METGTHEDVKIEINGKSYEIRRGPEPVSRIKEIGGVPAAYELEEILDGRLKPLPDDGTVDIKGGERFVSHPRSGGAS